MTEAAFPLLGTVFVLFVVLPGFGLAAKLALVLLERDEVGGPLHGLNARYLLLTAASLLPVAWFLSAGLHEIEAATPSTNCALDHGATRCFEPGFFAIVLGACVLTACVRVMWSERRARPTSSESANLLLERIARLLSRNASLADLDGRIVVTNAETFAIATHGWLRPRVVIGSAFAASLSDDMLASALGHEREHVRAFDPLRYSILKLALAVNPLGRVLLQPHARRWQAAREAHCDRSAVVNGAAPIALADAIVRAARPHPSAVALGARDTTLLKFRVEMLLAFAEKPPAQCCRREPSALPLGIILLCLALVLPHQTSTAALDVLHTNAERVVSYF